MRFNSRQMKIKITIVIGIFFLHHFNLNAQEISIKLNGGPSGILYGTSSGNEQLKAGGGFGIGYSYFLTNHWAINTGLDFMYNQNSYKLNDAITINSYEIDDQTSAFEYSVTAKNFNEEQHFISFTIPVFLHYSTMISRQTEWYFGLGTKLLFPGKQIIKSTADEIQVSGYYPDLNIVVDDLPSHGFGKVTNWKDETSVNLKPSVLVSVETGLTFKLKKNLKLYAGLYADYGFNNLAEINTNGNILTYSPDGVNSIQAKGLSQNHKIVQSTHYLSTGIQLKLGFLKNKQKHEDTRFALVESNTVVENTGEKAEIVPSKDVEDAVKRNEITKEQRAYVEKPLAFNEVGNTNVTPELAERLDTIASILKKNDETELVVTGYTCDIGTEAHNIEIGQLRAQAVADYLKNKGIETNRIHLFSKGESEPLVPNTLNENRALNRRVSLLLIEAKH
jgi:outer membrane protein OmpA-like peptidoglycan-associated protein